MSDILGLYNYWVVIVLMMTGFYIVIARRNLIKKIIGLNIFQVSVFLLYISMGKVDGGTAPIKLAGEDHGLAPAVHFFKPDLQFDHYSNPLPSVLILTAIVVGVATTALGLAFVVRINESYGSIEEDEIHKLDEGT